MSGGFEINSFKKGITLNKSYIIERMTGNPTYGDYVPNNIDPKKLTRGFLLTVRFYYNYYLKLIAHVDKELYRELYGISKLQLNQKNFNKWKNFQIDVDEKILDSLKKYVSIDR